MLNRKLGKYEVIERLGRGGMAEVYRAYHASLDRYVAIKVLHTFLADAPEFKTRFEKEAQSVAKLKHPHIVQVYDFDYDPDDDSYYMVMELINGPTLKDRLANLVAQGARLPFGEVLRIVYEAAGALAYAHSQNMIHRDVKPANLMLENGKRVVLTDFGIAKILTGQQYTTTGGMVGTPAYMSPEQGMGETGDERSDLYSLGVIMFEALTGRLPYEAETPVAMILKHVNNPVPLASDLNPALPKSIDQILGRLLGKRPTARYQSMNDFINDLKRLKAGQIPAEEKSVLQTHIVPAKSSPKVQDTPPIVTTHSGVVVADDLETVVVAPPIARPIPTPVTSTPALAPAAPPAPPRRRIPWWGWLASILTVFVVGLGTMFFSNGGIPGFAFVPTETATPTSTSTPTNTPTATFTDTPTPSDTPSATPTLTPTNTPTDTPTATFTNTPTPTNTATDAATLTPSLTPNASLTAAYIRTATTIACDFDYEIISQSPEDGEDGDFHPVNEEYERTIILLNSGDCAWERNTGLYWLEGEDFNAVNPIFIREQVEAGAEVTLTFEGVLPAKGDLEPLSGTWQLRTPGQIPIGEPFEISILVYDPGPNN